METWFGSRAQQGVQGAATVALGLGVAAGALLPLQIGGGFRPLLLHALSVGVVAALAARFVGRAPSLGQVGGRASLAGALIWAVSTLLCLGLHRPTPGLFLLLIGGSVWLGGVAGLICVPAVRWLAVVRRARTLDAPAEALNSSGGWLALVGAGSAAALAASEADGVALVLPVVAALVGVALLLLAAVWDQVARRWLRRVAAGAVPGWILAPRPAPWDLPSFWSGDHADSPVLCRREAAPGGPYRGDLVEVPVARAGTGLPLAILRRRARRGIALLIALSTLDATLMLQRVQPPAHLHARYPSAIRFLRYHRYSTRGLSLWQVDGRYGLLLASDDDGDPIAKSALLREVRSGRTAEEIAVRARDLLAEQCPDYPIAGVDRRGPAGVAAPRLHDGQIDYWVQLAHERWSHSRVSLGDGYWEVEQNGRWTP